MSRDSAFGPEIRALVRSRLRAFGLLSAVAVAGGLLEAAFLVTVTRTAIAVAEGESSVTVTRSVELSIGEATAIGLAIVLLRLVASVLVAWLAARLSASVTQTIRRRLSSAFLGASWERQHGSRTGRLQELLTTFAQQGAALVVSLTQMVTAGFSLTALLVTAVVVDPAASLVVLAATIVLGFGLRPVRNAVRRQAGTAQQSGMGFATSLAEISQVGMETHIFGVRDQAQRQVFGLIGEHTRNQRRLRFLQTLVPAVYTGLAYLAVLGALAVVAQIDRTDLGAVGAVMLIMLRSLSYGQTVQSAAANINVAAPFLSELEREVEGYESDPAPSGTTETGPIERVELRDVSFAYPGGDTVLRGLDLSIGAREVIGIVGPSGSGKSTVVQLLLGLREPSVGTIEVNGVNLRDVARTEWHQRATFVPQDPHLLAGTVADNIRFLRPEITQEQIETAARLAHLHDDVTGWPDGYDRQVGDQGSHLSGGQQQRLIIARALVEQPDLLILDEPTSALDVRSEALIRETLDHLRSSMTIVVIAHRLSTLDICDRIMVIQDGELKAFDTPDRLEETSAFYREALELSGLR